MANDVIGWGLWISKPEYMVEKEDFWKSEGYDYQDVLIYAKTLDSLYNWYINITEYHTVGDGDFYEVDIEWRK